MGVKASPGGHWAGQDHPCLFTGGRIGSPPVTEIDCIVLSMLMLPLQPSSFQLSPFALHNLFTPQPFPLQASLSTISLPGPSLPSPTTPSALPSLALSSQASTPPP